MGLGLETSQFSANIKLGIQFRGIGVC